MIRGTWPTSPRTAGISVALMLVLIGLAALIPAFSQSGGDPVIRFQMSGPGTTFSTVYELMSGGVLETRRYSPGGKLLEARHLALDTEDEHRYLEILEQGGYFTAESEQLQLPEVQSKLGALMDLPDWKITVYRSPSEVVTINVPARYVGEFYPELEQIPYVSTAWRLLKEFEATWEVSKKLNR